MQITVHHLDDSRSLRLLWLLEELELEYDIREYKRDPTTMRAPESLRAIHPLGKAPVLEVDGDILAESGAIMENLIDRVGGSALRPTDREDVERYRYWLHYAEGSLMSPLLVKLIMSRLRGGKVPFFIRPISRRIADTVDKSFTDPEISRHFDFITQHLESHTWFAGDAFSAADIQMSYPLEAGTARIQTASEPIRAFIERIRARPAYVRAVERGGAYSF